MLDREGRSVEAGGRRTPRGMLMIILRRRVPVKSEHGKEGTTRCGKKNEERTHNRLSTTALFPVQASPCPNRFPEPKISTRIHMPLIAGDLHGHNS